MGSIGTRIATITFLLNSKAASYLNREDPRKKFRDGKDIVFLLDCMAGKNIRLGEKAAKQCNWLFNPRFWTTFTAEFPRQESKLTAIGFGPYSTAGNTGRSSLEGSSGRQSNSGWSITSSLGGGSGRNSNSSQRSRSSLGVCSGHQSGSVRISSGTSNTSAVSRVSSIWSDSSSY